MDFILLLFRSPCGVSVLGFDDRLLGNLDVAEGAVQVPRLPGGHLGQVRRELPFEGDESATRRRQVLPGRVEAHAFTLHTCAAVPVRVASRPPFPLTSTRAAPTPFTGAAPRHGGGC